MPQLLNDDEFLGAPSGNASAPGLASAQPAPPAQALSDEQFFGAPAPAQPAPAPAAAPPAAQAAAPAQAQPISDSAFMGTAPAAPDTAVAASQIPAPISATPPAQAPASGDFVQGGNAATKDIGKIGDYVKGAYYAMTAGAAKMNESANRVAGAVGAGADAVRGLFGADPKYAEGGFNAADASENAATYFSNKSNENSHGLSTKIVNSLAGAVPSLAVAIGTAGESAAPAINEATQTTLVAARDMLAHAMHTMRVPAFSEAVNAAFDASKAGDDPLNAAAKGVVKGMSTAVMGGLPMASRSSEVVDALSKSGVLEKIVNGVPQAVAPMVKAALMRAAGLGEQAATGATLGGSVANVQRQVDNILSPADQQQPFSLDDTIVGAGTGAVFGLSHGAEPVRHAPDKVDLGYEPAKNADNATGSVADQLSQILGRTPGAKDPSQMLAGRPIDGFSEAELQQYANSPVLLSSVKAKVNAELARRGTTQTTPGGASDTFTQRLNPNAGAELPAGEGAATPTDLAGRGARVAGSAEAVAGLPGDTAGALEPGVHPADPAAVGDTQRVATLNAGTFGAADDVTQSGQAHSTTQASALADAAAKHPEFAPAAGPGADVLERNPRFQGVRDELAAAQVGIDRAAQSARASGEDTSHYPVLSPITDPDLFHTSQHVADVFENVFGTRPVMFADPSARAPDGLAMGGKSFVNAANLHQSIMFTGTHEFWHTAEQAARKGDVAAQSFVDAGHSIFDMMSDASKLEYARQFLFKKKMNQEAGPAQMTPEMALDHPTLKSEMVGDFWGKRAEDRAFWGKLAKQDPQGFGRYTRNWIDTLDKLIAGFKQKVGLGVRDTDKAFSAAGLKRARNIAADALIEWRRANPALARELPKPGESASFSGKLDMAPHEVVDHETLREAQQFRVKDKPKESSLTYLQANRAQALLEPRILMAREMLPEYTATVKDIARSLGVDEHVPDIKGMKRASEKLVEDYDYDASKVKDLLRGSITVERLSDVPKAIDEIKQKFDVTKIKDRFTSPTEAGYRDVLMNVRMPNGLEAEIQVHIPEMIAAKKLGHPVYEESRSHTKEVAADRARYVSELQNRIYGQAYERAVARDASRSHSDQNSSAEQGDAFMPKSARLTGRADGVNSQQEPSGNLAAGMSPSQSARTAPDGIEGRSISDSKNHSSIIPQNEGERGAAASFSGKFDASNPDIRASAKQDDNQSRVGKVDTHARNTTRGERATTERTMLSSAEKVYVKSAAAKMKTEPAAVEQMVRAHKSAHPTDDGWAPLKFIGAKVPEEGGKAELKYKVTPYDFNTGANGKAFKPGTLQYKRAVDRTSDGMLDEVRQIFERAKNGDEAARKIIAQAGWYKEMRTRLRQEFGGLGDLFADLLGATSPNTPVRTNWDNSVEFLRRLTKGDYDKLMPKWQAWVKGADDFDNRFSAYVNEMKDRGLTMADIKRTDEYKWLAKRASEVRAFPKELMPLKDNGKMFGFNGKNGVRAAVDLWRVVKNANPDIKRGGTAPKAINFSGNLIGFRPRATIDVWAARMLQRISGGKRIPSMSEGGVSGSALENGDNTLQFGFGQDVFSRAADLIRRDADMSSDPTLRHINDDDLQALVWFIEKERWTKNNWTSAAGEGGGFEFESDLAGVQDRAGVNALRKIADSSVSSTPQQRADAISRIAELDRSMAAHPLIATANRTLELNADTLAKDKLKPKSERMNAEERDRLRESNQTARTAIKKARTEADFKAMQSERTRMQGMLKKPTQEESQAKRTGAVQQLGAMARTVDRYTAGLSIQKGAEQGMEPTPPTDHEMASLAHTVSDAITSSDPGATVIGLKATSSKGMYGAPERALDLEVIARDGFDAKPMASAVFEAAKTADQDAAFVARVLRPDEAYDPLVHRAGIEIYFRDSKQAQDAVKMMAEIAGTTVAKPTEFGPSRFNIGGYTIVVDGRRTPDTLAGKMGTPVGMRVMHMPEFDARYGGEDISKLPDAALREKMQGHADSLGNFADAVLRKYPGVSFAGRFNYEVDTRFAGEYQGAIDGYANGKSEAGTGPGRGTPWRGRSVRESVAAAVARPELDGGQPRAELPHGNDAVSDVRLSGKQQPDAAGSGRDREVLDGPERERGARYGRATAGAADPVSTAKRSALTGDAYGSGLRGAEHERVFSSPDTRLRQRIYFYANKGTGINPESGVGGHAHGVSLDNLYDTASGKIRGNGSEFESAVLNAGYDGYLSRLPGKQSDVAVLLGKHAVPVDYLGQGKEAASGARVNTSPADQAGDGATQSRQEQGQYVLKPNRPQDQLGMVKARDELKAAAPSYKMQYGEHRVDAADRQASNDVLAQHGLDVRFSGKDDGEPQRALLADDLKAQEGFLLKHAQDAGYKTIDEFVDKDYGAFERAAGKWREEQPAEALYSAKQDPAVTKWARSVLDGDRRADVARVISKQQPHGAFEMAGLGRNRPIVMSADDIRHLVNSGHIGPEVSSETIGALKDLLSRPRAIIKGTRTDKRSGELIPTYEAIVDSRDRGGNPLLVVLHPRESGALKIAEVRTMYGKTDSLAYVMEHLQNGKMFWMPKEEIGRVKDFTDGRQLPKADGSAVPPQTDRSDPTLENKPMVSRPTGPSVLSDAALGKYAQKDNKGWQHLREEVPVTKADVQAARKERLAFSEKPEEEQKAAAAKAGPLRAALDGARKAGDAMLKVAKGLHDDMLMSISPMSMGSHDARAVAKDYANAERLARSEWNRIDDKIKTSFTEEQRRDMWSAADEQNDILTRGDTPGPNEGINKLPADQRAVMDWLPTKNVKNLHIAT